MKTKERKIYLDFLRIIACFLVIFNHLPGYTAYQSSTSCGVAFYDMFYTMITRINVPIFFMISGTLLLSAKTTYKDLFFKRISRILGALFCACTVYYIVRQLLDSAEISIIDFLKKFLEGGHSGAYWYLYAYLGFLLTLPMMQRIAQHFTTADFILLLSVHFITSTFLPIINYILNFLGFPTFYFSSDFKVPLMTTKAFFYPLIGYYIDRIFDVSKLDKKHIFHLTALSCLGIIIASCLTYHEGITSGFTQNFVQTFDYILAINLFITVKYLFQKYNSLNNCKLLPFLSSLTFGIYLMDPVVKRCIKYKFFDAIIPYSYPIFHSFMWCLFSMTICGFATYMIKKVPLARKLL